MFNAETNSWILDWNSSFQDHHYEPLYLANGTFGGMLDLSGTKMDLWSSLIGAVPEGQDPADGRVPVTALRTRVFYRNKRLREEGIWLSSAGIHCSDPRYTSNPSIPHLAQVYDCQQSLDLRSGLATTSGRTVLGSQTATGSRSIPYKSRIAFLKDSTVMGIEISSSDDVEILFTPELVLKDRLVLGSEALGIANLGNQIDCDLSMSQELVETQADGDRISYLLKPSGGMPYKVTLVSQTDAELTDFQGHPAFLVSGCGFFLIEIQPGADSQLSTVPSSAEEFFSEQNSRWTSFWRNSRIELPEEESLWQQRYHTSLYNVAQSMGDGPTHPGGLSKPMMPYWSGCFHDTDTYFVRALLETGHGDAAARHLAYRFRTLPAARELAAKHNRHGAMYPWQTDMDGRGLPHEVPVNSAIIAVEAWHHYLHTRAPEALGAAREILSETLLNLADHLDQEVSPLQFKPEPLATFSETMVDEDATEVRVALRAVAASYLDSLAPSGTVLQSDTLSALAKRILDELTLPLHPSGGYRIGAKEDPVYLRCPSVTLGSFPLHHLAADETLGQTFDRELQRILFLFAWLPHQASVVASQLSRSDGEASGHALLRSADAFYKPWHACDEWENRRAVRAVNYVTAAGGFCLAMHAILLAETSPGVWSLYPGAPNVWNDLAFQNLHTRAGWRVSARRVGGRTIAVEAVPVAVDAAPEFTLQIPDLDASLSDRNPPDAGNCAAETFKLTHSNPLKLGTFAAIEGLNFSLDN